MRNGVEQALPKGNLSHAAPTCFAIRLNSAEWRRNAALELVQIWFREVVNFSVHTICVVK
jgi:hypothetical protein